MYIFQLSEQSLHALELVIVNCSAKPKLLF